MFIRNQSQFGLSVNQVVALQLIDSGHLQIVIYVSKKVYQNEHNCHQSLHWLCHYTGEVMFHFLTLH